MPELLRSEEMTVETLGPCAPILISVYNRREHLQKCVESLAANPLSRQSDLYVVSDAAFAPADEAKINLVRQYIGQIVGFRQVIAINREQNLGSFLSVKSALDEVLARYGRAIFIEDDNIVSPNFLGFLNDGLEFYQDDPLIFSISAYNYPVQIPASYSYDVYKWQGFSAWGVGVWLDRWQKIDWEYTVFDQVADGRSRKRQMDRIAEHLYAYISYDIQRGRKIIDTIISYYMFTRGLYSIFPVVSKVRNTGHDGTGEHGGITDLYVRQPTDPGESYQLVKGIAPDHDINRVLRRHFRIPLRAKVRSALGSFVPPRQKEWIKRRILLLPGSSPSEVEGKRPAQ